MVHEVQTPDPMSHSPSRKLDVFAALLSYLVPGLGQIYQGRVSKGILFLVSLHVLFFYGMWLGQFRNVYLPHTDTRHNVVFTSTILADVENRLQFAGQFFIGVAAWPALIQYASDPNLEKHPLLGTWQRAPRHDELNALQRNGDKRWDLGWVYTVIAGVLNILVIYDALAGPAVREAPDEMEQRVIAT
jgi:TM2 domain-containing membrane protein YozV